MRNRRVKTGNEHTIPDSSVAPLVDKLNKFVDPYRRLFGREEAQGHAKMYVAGRMQRLDRRTLEPIATERGVHRRPLQMFVGAGRWSDGPVRDKMNEQVAEDLGTSDGVLILDGSGFQKWGDQSVGVQRQYCGRLGKIENCQVAEYLAYASPKGHTLVDVRLYLPESWANDLRRRTKAHVPKDVKFRRGWELSYEMVQARGSVLPHEWTLGDDAYGRVTELRDLLNTDKEPYILEVPADTLVRQYGAGKPRRVSEVANAIAKKDWASVRTRDGEKGPINVRATKLRVIAGKEGNRRRETLLIVRHPSTGERWFYLSNRKGVSVAKMAKAAACRHYIEQAIGTAKGDVGLAEYEVRSWVGWHHHMTLSLLAMLFLVCQQTQLKKRPRR